jgi:hypothetical protein
MNEPEVQASQLPPASLEALEHMRTEACSRREFRLQPFQLMMRRILSPDSPTRSMLLVHGTGVGKTCTAIQVAEEYILRPEFQSKKVIVLASEAVQDNFRKQVFDVDRIGQGQCTGSRYMDMLRRAQNKHLRFEVPEHRDVMKKIIDKMIDEFYEFNAYIAFANQIEEKSLSLKKAEFELWIHETFDNRLLIVDEAHALRAKTGDKKEDEGKQIAIQLEKVLKVAQGMTLVLLTATPMYDVFQEILYYFQLFLWNEGREMPKTPIFTEEGDCIDGESEALFRSWVHSYVSVIRGENPFTFPFRLPPPESRIAPLDRTLDVRGQPITEPRKYLPLVYSVVEGAQKKALLTIDDMDSARNMFKTLCVSPDPKRTLADCFVSHNGSYSYAVEPFLSPSKLRNVSTKYATILDCLESSEGLVFVFSNYVTNGVEPLAMALEEHGYDNASGKPLLLNPSKETTQKRGKYALLSSSMTPTELVRLISRLRSPMNDIRIVIGSPLVAEGIDLKRVRQVHVLDPWFNMSRIDQVIGRGLRTCSHTGLPLEQQNCTVYLHICRHDDIPQETFDEYVYRVFVERKAKAIAKVKRILMESAIDCRQQLAANELPEDWKSLIVPQTRSERSPEVRLPIAKMSSPNFEDGTSVLVCYEHPVQESPEVRPLSTYYDVKDNVVDTLLDLFHSKPIWKLDELERHPKIRVNTSVFHFLLQDALLNRVQVRDSHGRSGYLEGHDGLIAFTPEDAPPNATYVERILPASKPRRQILEYKEEDVVKPTPSTPVKEESFPAGIEEDIKEWIRVDRLPLDEKRKAFRENPRAPYAADLSLGPMLIMGHEQIFDTEDTLLDNVVGADKDALEAWTRAQAERLVGYLKENRILASKKKDGKFVITGFDVKDGALVRSSRQKTIGAKVCSFYDVPQIDALLSALGHSVEGSRDTKCNMLQMLVHQSNPYVQWIQPEIWSVLNDNEENRKLLRSLLNK